MSSMQVDHDLHSSPCVVARTPSAVSPSVCAAFAETRYDHLWLICLWFFIIYRPTTGRISGDVQNKWFSSELLFTLRAVYLNDWWFKWCNILKWFLTYSGGLWYALLLITVSIGDKMWNWAYLGTHPEQIRWGRGSLQRDPPWAAVIDWWLISH